MKFDILAEKPSERGVTAPSKSEDIALAAHVELIGTAALICHRNVSQLYAET